MSGQHTPGPWHANLHHERRDGGRFYVYVTAESIVPIAGVPSGVEGFGREEGRANALLIAAAPDLLEAHLAWEAAEDARNDCNGDDGCDNEGPWEACGSCSDRFGAAIDLRHAAIAKATHPTAAGERGR